MIAAQCADCGQPFVPTVGNADMCEPCVERLERAYEATLEREAYLAGEFKTPVTPMVRCPDHRGTGATQCPRGGAALQVWQRQQWEGAR